MNGFSSGVKNNFSDSKYLPQKQCGNLETSDLDLSINGEESDGSVGEGQTTAKKVEGGLNIDVFKNSLKEHIEKKEQAKKEI